ncbi:MFS transporter [Alloacidobacterium sp.]|uniref:MFS transporter n=1 Tax=Alloacidobacterium sp. TaxID=2951999 RepID=UPI002D40F0E7|nr:MFS transporter [Alloacidobacterium sp.]HYK36244.1 MFS transporter [Alloacidobacterium sp.]
MRDSSAAQPGTMYTRFLIFIAGLGGLLYGIDVGIIAAALLYLSKTIDLTVSQTSIIVAAVLGGSMVSSPVAGFLADWFGRKRMMIVSGLMFVASVGLIVLSQGFASLFVGRLLQGMSGGVIAVVVPLYLAECLGADNRGRGTAVFQFMLTFGIVVAATVGWFYTRQAETAIAHATGNLTLIHAAQNRAWRSMFLAVVYPGIAFFAGAFFLAESPRWLFRKKRTEEARKALLRSLPAPEADRELKEMESLAIAPTSQTQSATGGSLLQRKYVIPFVLACVILAFNQATGINSVLGFLVIILKQAGLTATHATQGDVAVKVLNCVMTFVAVGLVDKKGRRFLLKIGTGGVVLSLAAGGIFFLSSELNRVDVKSKIEAATNGNAVIMPVNETTLGPATGGRPMSLTVLYSYGDGSRMETVLSTDDYPVLTIKPDASETEKPLTITKAKYGPVPRPVTSWLITLCMAVFIAAYAVGPGVVVWLVLSELMPTRIRSAGMGIALLLNQGVSTLSAAVFLPVVGSFGYSAMFFAWAGCTVIYFLTATLFVPETKGKTLEEIEVYFSGKGQLADAS